MIHDTIKRREKYAWTALTSYSRLWSLRISYSLIPVEGSGGGWANRILDEIDASRFLFLLEKRASFQEYHVYIIVTRSTKKIRITK